MLKDNSFLVFLFLVPILLYWVLNIFFIDENNEVNIVYWFVNYPSLILSLIYFFKCDFFVKNSIHNKFFYPLFILFIISFFHAALLDINVNVKNLLQYALTFPILYSSFSMGLNIKKSPNQKKLIVLISKIFIVIAFILTMNALSEYGFLSLLQKRPYTYCFYFLCIMTYFIVSNKSENNFNKIIFILLSLVITFFSGSRSCLILILVLSLIYVFRTNFLILSVPLILIIIGYNNLVVFIEESRLVSGETNLRYLIWENVLNQINENEKFIFGNNFIKGNFITDFGDFSIAHNTYLQMFFSYGLFGVVLSSSAFYFFFKSIYKKHILLFIAFAVISFINDLPLLTYEWSRIAEAMIFFFFFGSIFQSDDS